MKYQKDILKVVCISKRENQFSPYIKYLQIELYHEYLKEIRKIVFPTQVKK